MEEDLWSLVWMLFYFTVSVKYNKIANCSLQFMVLQLMIISTID